MRGLLCAIYYIFNYYKYHEIEPFKYIYKKKIMFK